MLLLRKPQPVRISKFQFNKTKQYTATLMEIPDLQRLPRHINCIKQSNILELVWSEAVQAGFLRGKKESRQTPSAVI